MKKIKQLWNKLITSEFLPVSLGFLGILSLYAILGVILIFSVKLILMMFGVI